MSKRQARRARVAALQSGDPVAAQARAEGNQARVLEMRRAQEATTNRIAAGRIPSRVEPPSVMREDEPRADDYPSRGIAVSGRGGGGRFNRLALIPLLLAGLEADERRQR